MAYNIADFIEHAVDLMPDRTALETDGASRTYAELEARANALAHQLRAFGVEPGETVGVYSRNTLECVEAMVAIFKARAVMVNVNFRYVESELEHIFTDSEMKVLIYERQFTQKVAKVLPKATGQVMAGKPEDTNSLDEPFHTAPKEFAINDASASWNHTFPGNSVTVVRFKTR